MGVDRDLARAAYAPRAVPAPPPGKRGWPWDVDAQAVSDCQPRVLPRVTVVTPSYNQGLFIEECIRSVLLQDYPNLEYMVIDGGSHDDTVGIVQKYAGALAHYVSEPDRGQAHAINKGWRRASGEILAWLNADDVYLPGAITHAVSTLMANPSVGLVYGNGYHISEQGKMLDAYPSEPFDLQRLGDTCYICQPTVFLRRHLAEAVDYVDETLRYALDYDLWLRIAQRSAFQFIPEFLAQSRLHKDCKTVKHAVPRAREVLAMLYKHYHAVPPLKVGGYAYARMEACLGTADGWKRIPFLLGMAGIFAAEFFRYNLHMPASERMRWGRGMREGLQKFRQRKVVSEAN